MFNKLRQVILDEWDIMIPDDIDLDMTLRQLAEGLACQIMGLEFNEENVKNVYAITIGESELHYVGCIAFSIIYDMRLDIHKVNSGWTLRDILAQKI